MKITVNLDSQVVVVQPLQLRIKAGAFVPLAITFTCNSQIVSLPAGAGIEFALKPRNQWTGVLLAYLNAFTLTAGNIYTGTLNCASTSLLGALGLNDSTPLNDLPMLEASAEVTWSFNGQKFRSSTFPVIVETPLTDDNPVPLPDPELYPAPADIALKGDLATVAISGNYNDLSNKPTLGSAANHDASDFATAAQGAKADSAVQPGQLAAVAFSGKYGDLLELPTIPEPQVSSDWDAASGVAQILNKPALGSASAHSATDFATAAQGGKADTAVQPGQLPLVATSGNYSDLSEKPVLGTAAAQDVSAFATAAQGAEADAVAAVTGIVKVAGGTFAAAQAGIDYAYANVKIVSGTCDAVAGDLIADNGSALTVNLPSGPGNGDTVTLVNASGSWGTGAPGSIVVNGNGATIGTLQQLSSSTSSISCDTNDYLAIRFVYSSTLNQWIALAE